MKWTVLVPLRALPTAKSRLAADLPPELHAPVVAAIRADTLAAVRAAEPVARVVVIGDVAGEGIDLVQHSPGLNGALHDGFVDARERWPDDGVAALVADLPALRPDELAAALDAAAAHTSAFVPDSTGTGTTMLTVTGRAELDPRFGVESAARHAAIAQALRAGPGLRQDVDTGADLAAAARLGLGPATSHLFETHTVLPRSL